jgi:hypothetical protein
LCNKVPGYSLWYAADQAEAAAREERGEGPDKISAVGSIFLQKMVKLLEKTEEEMGVKEEGIL